MPHTNPDHAGPPATAGEPDPWQRVLDALHAAGADAGTTAADWWAQDTVGGRVSGDPAATARTVLAGIDDGDPLILDALPGCGPSAQDHEIPTEAELYTDAVPADAPDWDALDPQSRAETLDAFGDGYHRAVQDRVAEHCRTAFPDEDGSDVPWRRASSSGHAAGRTPSRTPPESGRS